MAAADSRARVFGTSSLQVADISAFPPLPSGYRQSIIPDFLRYLPAMTPVYVIVLIGRMC